MSADFKTIFSTTAKVWASVILIAAIVCAAVLILGGLLAGLGSVAKSADSGVSTATDDMGRYVDEARRRAADGRRSSMPRSAWNAGIARAIKNDCVTDGMNQSEVLQALGQPAEKTDYDWKWNLRPGKCLKFDGENCAEREQNQEIVFFTPNGNVYKTGENCQTLDQKDQYVFINKSQIFRPSRE